jgi:threonine dehydratase
MTTTTTTTTDLAPPTPEDILAARRFVAASHARTPLRRLLEAGLAAGREIYVKCEDEAEIKSFKGRGALWLLACLERRGLSDGVVTASTGNHGQGVAYAAARVGVRSVVVVPAGSSPLKMDRIREFGAELRVSGTGIAEASQAAQAAALAEGMVYVEDGEDPELMAGASTVGWEILEDLPATEAIVVPVGGGNLIAGVALAAKRLKPSVRIIGVQSEAAPAVVRSWELKRLVELPCATFAGGLATSFPGKLAFGVIRDLVDEMYLVSEAELRAEIRHALATRATLLEGAAAAPFAALRRYGADWPTQTVLVQSGANLSLDELERVLATGAGS